MNELRRAFDAARYASEQRSYVYGVLGRADGVVAVAERAGWVHVRVSSEADRTPATARNPNAVPYRANLPVKMRREQGALVIVGVDTGALLDAATSGDAPNPYGVPAHTHATTGPMSYTVESLRLAPGQVHSAGGLTVRVEPFRYYYDRFWDTYEGETISLGSHRPATTGKHRWVILSVDPITNTLVATDGSEEDYATTLTPAMVDAITNAMDNDNIILAGVRVRNDDTGFTDIAKYYDARPWLDVPVTPTSLAEAVQDMFDGFWVNSDTIDINYDDGANTVSFDVDTTKFLLLAGQPGGQVANGGTAANEDLTLHGTAHATKTSSFILLQPSGGRVGINTGANDPTAALTVDGSIRARQAGSIRYRADFALAAGNGVMNAYDDVGATYIPFYLDGLDIHLRTGAGATERVTINSTGNLIMADGLRIETDEVRARDSGGLKLYEDGGVGVFIKDSNGNVGIHNTDAPHPLTVDGVIFARQVGSTRYRFGFNPASAKVQMNAYDDTGGVYIPIEIEGSTYTVHTGTAGTINTVIDASGNLGINQATAAISDGVGIDVNGKILRLRTSKTPASAAATGNAGEICWDSSFLYVCTAANTWKRVAIATW